MTAMSSDDNDDPTRSNKVSSICSECGAPIAFELGAVQVKCDHCQAGLAVEKGAKLLRLGCPNCGGNFYYIDGSLCGRCPYCETALMALCKDRVLRLVVRPKVERPAEAGEGATLKLLPFWHLGGLVFAWNAGSKVEIVEDRPSSSQEQEGAAVQTIRKDSGPMKVFGGRVLDISIPDPAALGHGVTSLRLRGAVFPVEPFAEEHESIGEVVPATIDHRVAKDRLFSRAMNLSNKEGMTRVDCRRFDVIAERLSLLYYPFWVASDAEGALKAWDAVSGEPEPLSPGEQPEYSATPLFDNLQLVELKCGACGHELPAGNHAMILPCRGCGAFWQVTSGGLQPFQARYARPHLQAQKLAWLPFWQLPVGVTYGGQRAQVANNLTTALGVLRPPSQAPQSPPNSQLTYFAPAYGAMRAPRVDHAARDMTRHQPLLEPGEPGAGELYNCFFSPEDALRLAYATFILILPGTVPRMLRSLRVITAGDPELWYVPFEDAGRELMNLLTGVRYDKSAFRGVRH